MNNQLKKGILEMVILSFLLKEEMHGYLIVQKLDPFIKVKESSIYVILVRLAQNGYLNVRSDMNGARMVKMYSISDSGRKYLDVLYEQWEEITYLVDFSRKDENV